MVLVICAFCSRLPYPAISCPQSGCPFLSVVYFHIYLLFLACLSLWAHCSVLILVYKSIFSVSYDSLLCIFIFIFSPSLLCRPCFTGYSFLSTCHPLFTALYFSLFGRRNLLFALYVCDIENQTLPKFDQTNFLKLSRNNFLSFGFKMTN